MRALPPSELAHALGAMATAQDSHADSVAAGVAATANAPDDLWSDVVLQVDDRWGGLADALVGHSDERVRRIRLAALAATVGSGRK